MNYTHRIVNTLTGVRPRELRFTSKAEAEQWIRDYRVSEEYKQNYRVEEIPHVAATS